MDIIEELSIELTMVQAMAITIDMMQYFIDTDQCRPDKLAHYFGKHWTKTGELYCVPSPYDCYPDIYIDTKHGNMLYEYTLGEDGFQQTAAYCDGFVFYFPNLVISGPSVPVYEFRYGPYHVQECRVRYNGSYEDKHIKIENLRCDIHKSKKVDKYWGTVTYPDKITINHVKIINKKTGKAYTLDQSIPANFARMKNGFYDCRRMKPYEAGDYTPHRRVCSYEQVIDQIAPLPYYPSHRTAKEMNRIKQNRKKHMEKLTNPIEVLSYSAKPVLQFFNAAEILELRPTYKDIVLSQLNKITFGRKSCK